MGFFWDGCKGFVYVFLGYGIQPTVVLWAFYAFSTDFYAYLWLILRRFWGGLGANLRVFMVCLRFLFMGIYGFSMVCLCFSWFFLLIFMVDLWSLGAVTKFYGYSTRVAVKIMVILRLWVMCLAR